MLSAGLDGLAARLELIDHAEKTLDLQYYIFRADESGTLVMLALLRAADRGVRIRVLVDDGESVAGDERLFALAAHPLVQIRVFNPFDYRGHAAIPRAVDFTLHKGRLDHRMHNKLLVVDNALALIGGRNIGNQYFQIDPNSQFGDDDVLAYGPIVPKLSGVYDLFWNSMEAVPIQAIDPQHSSATALAALRATASDPHQLGQFQAELDRRLASGAPLAGLLSQATPLDWTTAELVYDSPDKAAQGNDGESAKQLYPAIAARAAQLTRELLMITPYFVPSDAEMSTITQARQRHVRVAFLTNSLESAPDVVAHAGYTRHRAALLAAGVEAYEIRALPEGATRGTGQPKRLSNYGNYGLHAKLYIFDRRSLFVGSMNFDQRSKHINTEIGLIVDSPSMARAAADRFGALASLKNAYTVTAGPDASLHWRTERDGKVVESAQEPARSAWQRFESRFLIIIPLDTEL
jgi:cardiolipin synthase C